MEQGKTVFDTKMFRTLIQYNPLRKKVNRLHERREVVRKMIEATEQKIINCSLSRWDNVRYTRRKAFEEKMRQQQEELEELDRIINDCIYLIENRTIKAAKTKPSNKYKRPE